LNIDDVKQEIFETANQFSFLQKIHLIDETDFAVKFRLEINASTFIQIYHNVSTDTISYILVHGLQRFYGRDCCSGIWHRHPFENPASHDFSPEGSQPISFNEFLKEVECFLIEKELF